MLESAFANWIGSIPERAFDASFLSLLRAQGFYDIHFTHGAYEFGKDFIAKKTVPPLSQFGFQSKAGDINGAEWSAIYGQLEELVGTFLAHPNFDRTLPAIFVLVTTGRLVGKAVIGPMEFRERLHRDNRGTFEVWDVDTLVEMLSGSARFPIQPSSHLMPIVGRIEARLTSERTLEEALAALIPTTSTDESSLHRLLVDNAICVASLVAHDAPFQALCAALNGVRIGATRAHQGGTDSTEVMRQTLDSYVALGKKLLGALLENPDDTQYWQEWTGGVAGRIVTYPVTCLKVLEFLGLAALHLEGAGELDEARRLADIAVRVIAAQPGSFHPISDRMAASIIPPTLALTRWGHTDAAQSFLTGITKWLCDWYEKSEFGLASPYSTPEEEVATLLGAPFESVKLQDRRESVVAVAVADLAYYVAPDAYELITNDLKAVGIMPSVVHPKDDAQAYVVKGGATQGLINISYPDKATASLLPHHALQTAARLPEQLAGIAPVLAISCLTRDRLFTDCVPRFLKAAV